MNSQQKFPHFGVDWSAQRGAANFGNKNAIKIFWRKTTFLLQHSCTDGDRSNGTFSRISELKIGIQLQSNLCTTATNGSKTSVRYSQVVVI